MTVWQYVETLSSKGKDEDFYTFMCEIRDAHDEGLISLRKTKKLIDNAWQRGFHREERRKEREQEELIKKVDDLSKNLCKCKEKMVTEKTLGQLWKEYSPDVPWEQVLASAEALRDKHNSGG